MVERNLRGLRPPRNALPYIGQVERLQNSNGTVVIKLRLFPLTVIIPVVRIVAARSLLFVAADIPAARFSKTEFSLVNGVKVRDESAHIPVKPSQPGRIYKPS